MDFSKLQPNTYYHFHFAFRGEIDECRSFFGVSPVYGLFYSHKNAWFTNRDSGIDLFKDSKIIHCTWQDFKNLCSNSNSFKRRYVKL